MVYNAETANRPKPSVHVWVPGRVPSGGTQLVHMGVKWGKRKMRKGEGKWERNV